MTTGDLCLIVLIAAPGIGVLLDAIWNHKS